MAPVMDIVINRKLVSVPILPIATVLILVVSAATTLRVGRIQPDEIGVFVNNMSGDVTVKIQPGANVYNAWLTDFYVLDNVEQSYEMSASSGRNDAVRIKTRDGADVTLDVTINYRLTSDVGVIKNRVVPESGLGKVAGVDAYKIKWIRPYRKKANDPARHFALRA